SQPPIQRTDRRKRKSITVTVMLLIVSVLILIFGLAATTRTQNITVGGYYPGLILGFGSFLGIIGAHLIENKRQMLVASIVFISFGAVAAFCCAIVDGVFAARHIVSTTNNFRCSRRFLHINVPKTKEMCTDFRKDLPPSPSCLRKRTGSGGGARAQVSGRSDGQ
uniref:Transmembrane protein 255A n=1 Tax=Fundulus heteroclitus TaxID=8078 RepID=A0A3Q2PT02_FUNHE